MRALIENHRSQLMVAALIAVLLLTALLIVAVQTLDADSFIGDINNPPSQPDPGGTW